MNPVAQAFLDRLKAEAQTHTDLSHLSDWIVRNTKHPKDDKKPWNFRGHEFQRDIVNDSAAEVDVRKCSQVGVSEIFARLTLAYLAVKQNHTAIYTLPTSSFAAKFSKSRLDPIISASQSLSGMVPSDSDSAGLKQIGRSFLHIAGTFTQSAAISVPADMLVNDEVDFSNPVVLTTYESRLGHAENGGLKRRFSTPTVSGIGISAGMENSSQAHYAVKCDSCHQWVMPEFFEHVVLPGFDDHLLKFEKADILEKNLDVSKAWLKCPTCHNELKPKNLADPDKRQWVHAKPDHPRHGYQVSPFDAPMISSVGDTLGQIEKYERKADWVNFKVGLPFEDAETSILSTALERAFSIRPVVPQPMAASGCVLGMDVGKVCHIMVGRRINPMRMEIIHAESVRQNVNSFGENTAITRAQELLEYFGCSRAVVDAGPDFSIALALITSGLFGQVYANYYTRSAPSKLTNFQLDEAEQIAKSYRTGTIDHTVKQVNTGRVQFCKNDQIEAVKEHLRAIKRVTKQNAAGDDVAHWVNSGPDHYAHALNYLMIADTLNANELAGNVIGVLPMASSVKLKTIHRDKDGYDYAR